MHTSGWSGFVLCALLGCAGPKSSTAGEDTRPSAEAPAESPAEAPTPKPLGVTAAPAPKDDISIQSAELQGDTLLLKVMHSGGCARHTYDLLWSGTFQKSAAGEAQAELVLAHDANGDACEALLRRTASFDLGPLKQRWREQNKGEHGTVELRFVGSPLTSRYAF